MNREQLLVEFDVELPFFREHIARVPDDKLEWKPHEKSMTAKNLAGFLGSIWSWATPIFTQATFDAAAAMRGTPPVLNSTQELLAHFDRNSAAARQTIASVDDAELLKPWRLEADGKLWFEQPKWLCWRTYVMNHAVHHRAQLGVFLRLMNVPVPAVYNDSADEHGGMFRMKS